MRQADRGLRLAVDATAPGHPDPRDRARGGGRGGRGAGAEAVPRDTGEIPHGLP
jgi:hypothetical protein